MKIILLETLFSLLKFLVSLMNLVSYSYATYMNSYPLKNLKSQVTNLINIQRKNGVMDQQTVVCQEHKRHRRHFGKFLRTTTQKTTTVFA